MVIDLAKIDFAGKKGGTGPVIKVEDNKTEDFLLQDTELIITPSEGYDALKQVTVTHAPVETVTDYSVNNNGNYTIHPSEGFDATESVELSVNVPIESIKSVEYTSNGDYQVDPSEGFLAIGGVKVKVNTPTTQIETNRTVDITSNGQFTVTPSEGYDALKQVTINANIPIGGATYFGTQLKEIGYVNEYDCSVLADEIAYSKTVTDPDKWMYDKKLQICPLVDTSSITSFYSIFSGCNYLSIVPRLNTSKGTDFSSMFYNCSSLTTIPQLDTSNGTSFSSMFYNCYSLTTIPQLDTSKGNSFYSMFSDCNKLTTIPQLDTSKGNSFSYMFQDCKVLTTVGGIDFTNDKNPPTSQTAGSRTFSGCSKLTDLTVNGIIENNKTFYDCPLSSDSIKSVLTAANKTTNTNAKNLWFKTTTITDDAEGTFVALVSECTSKGWTISGLTINPAE